MKVVQSSVRFKFSEEREQSKIHCRIETWTPTNTSVCYRRGGRTFWSTVSSLGDDGFKNHLVPKTATLDERGHILFIYLFMLSTAVGVRWGWNTFWGLLQGISHNNDVWAVIDDFNNLGRYRICKLSGVYWTLLEHTPDSRYRDCDVLSYNIIEYKSSFSQPLAARMFLISSVRTSCLLSPHLAF